MDIHLYRIINAHYDRCVDRIIHHLRRYPVNLDGVPNLRTLWDYWKYEYQEERSVFHDLIEGEVEKVVWQVVDSLPLEVGGLLTLWTDALDNLADGEEVEGIYFDKPEVVYELMRRVGSRAIDEPHRREVQLQLDREDLDRFERDCEPCRARTESS